jgi:hypothetical protein
VKLKLCVRVASLCVLLVTGVLSTASAQSLPSGWATSDIGAVGAAGSATGSGESFTVSGAGADIWDTHDAFRFAYLPLTGDGSIVARVASVQYVADWTKAGVMMRASLSAGSAQAMMIVSANKGLAFQRRVTTGGLSTHTSGGAGTAPYFVRLSRSGNVFTASKSTDGTTWATVGSDTISMPSTIYAGLAVSSHVSGVVATASFSNVSVSGVTSVPATAETLVFFRHGEKPSGGYGQLTCQGLQRALALPPVLTGRYGTPQYIFAPNPVPKVGDSAGSFDYVRPLATIEPTAIRLGMPVNAEYGHLDIAGLQDELLSSTYATSTVFIAWEHLKLQEIVQNIMNAYGGGVAVPAWPSGDYDSIYVVHLTSESGALTATFQHDYEGLNNLSTSCP